MTATTDATELPRPAQPRLGGALRRLARLTSPWTMPLAGKRWNPIFAVLEHRGRKSGRRYATPVAARRVANGFVISLAFGDQVDWYRNLMAAGDGALIWRGNSYPIVKPLRIDAANARAAFNPIQRAFLRLGGIDGYVRVDDAQRGSR